MSQHDPGKVCIPETFQRFSTRRLECSTSDDSQQTGRSDFRAVSSTQPRQQCRPPSLVRLCQDLLMCAECRISSQRRVPSGRRLTWTGRTCVCMIALIAYEHCLLFLSL